MAMDIINSEGIILDLYELYVTMEANLHVL